MQGGIHARVGKGNHFLLGVKNDQRQCFAKTKTCLGLGVFGGKANMLRYVCPDSTQNVQEDIQQASKKTAYILNRRRRIAHGLVWSSYGCLLQRILRSVAGDPGGGLAAVYWRFGTLLKRVSGQHGSNLFPILGSNMDQKVAVFEILPVRLE